MPRMDGRVTLAEIKTDPDLRVIPVVVLTTSGSPPNGLDSYRHHANAYVTRRNTHAALSPSRRLTAR
jgi:CheY-like chemotaxis protein